MDFRLQTHLDNVNDSLSRQFALNVTTPEGFELWQEQFRPALADILRIKNRIPEGAPETELLSTVDRGDYIEEKHCLFLDDVPIPMYLLIPKARPPYKAILAFHGHGIGVQQILGNYADEATRQKMTAADENFAQQFAEDGYLVCAIEQQGFGQRVTEQVENIRSCRHLAFQYMMSGKSLAGERVREGMAAINYLLSRNDVESDFLACVGHSGGATTALFLSALDTRLTETVISGYFCDYQHSILGMPHCECNYVPDLLTLADIGDIASLIAPRNLLLINGRNDHIFPYEGFHKPYQTLQTAYHLMASDNNLSAYTHDNGHQFNCAATLNWLNS